MKHHYSLFDLLSNKYEQCSWTLQCTMFSEHCSSLQHTANRYNVQCFTDKQIMKLLLLLTLFYVEFVVNICELNPKTCFSHTIVSFGFFTPAKCNYRKIFAVTLKFDIITVRMNGYCCRSVVWRWKLVVSVICF